MMRSLQVALLMPLVAGFLAAGACELGDEEQRERPQTTAKDAVSLALEFGRQGMPDAQLDTLVAFQDEAPLEDGRAEEWAVLLCSPSTGLRADLAVRGDGELLLDHLFYRSFESLQDIPVLEVSPDEAWIEDPLWGLPPDLSGLDPDAARSSCPEWTQDWLDDPVAGDSPAVVAAASTGAEAWYVGAGEDFDNVYVFEIRFWFGGGEWEVTFKPYGGGDKWTLIEVTLDPSGKVLDVTPTFYERID